MWKIKPAVFAVGREYQIMHYADCEATMWVTVGDKTYYDEVNGILRSNTSVHKVSVSMEELDREKSYTVFFRKVIDRKPYFAEMEEPEQKTFVFRPVPDENIRAYHIVGTDRRQYSCGFFQRQSRYAGKICGKIRQVIANAAAEYEAAGVTHRIVICHIPFTMRHPNIFDIETETYAEWTTVDFAGTFCEENNNYRCD